jgi:hypothetical protein
MPGRSANEYRSLAEQLEAVAGEDWPSLQRRYFEVIN